MRTRKKLTLNEAAKQAGISKSTLSVALKNGKISANKDDKGRYQIDPAELFRAFDRTKNGEQREPNPNTQINAASNTEFIEEIVKLRVELESEKRLSAQLRDQVEDLRARLDRESDERRSLTAVLTDQRQQQDKAQGKGLFSFFRKR